MTLVRVKNLDSILYLILSSVGLAYSYGCKAGDLNEDIKLGYMRILGSIRKITFVFLNNAQPRAT